MKNKIGLYAGSFDPLTNGHQAVMSEASNIFDKLYVGVGSNALAGKKYMFTSDERAKMIQETVKMVGARDIPMNFQCPIEVVTYDSKFLSDIAMDLGVTHVVRGLRSSKDFEEELALRNALQQYFEMYDIGFVYIIAQPETALVSSSLVRSCLQYEEWEDAVAQMVPENVFKELKKKIKQ